MILLALAFQQKTPEAMAPCALLVTIMGEKRVKNIFPKIVLFAKRGPVFVGPHVKTRPKQVHHVVGRHPTWGNLASSDHRHAMTHVMFSCHCLRMDGKSMHIISCHGSS